MAETDARPNSNAARWLPSLTQWLWLVLLVILLTPNWRLMMVSSDGDACMHWRVGEWMLSNGQIISTDQFSHSRIGHPVISKEWLSEIIFAVAGRWRGLDGLAIVAALVIATTFALLHWQLIREGNSPLVASLITLLAAWAACSHWLARPHVFTFLMILLWNDVLRRYVRDRQALRLGLALAVLTMLWVNLHGAFLAGLFILGAYWLGALLERDRARLRELTIIGLVCLAASLVNPAGYKLHWHNLAFLQSDYLTNWLAEYGSTNFHMAGAMGFMAWLALIFFILTLLRPRLPASEGILLIMWGYFALYAGRNIPLFAILTAPILAGALTKNLPERWRDYSRHAAGAKNGWFGQLLVGAAAVTVIAIPHTPTTMPADRWPVEAVRYIKDHPDQFTGRMFNQYMWGGYLLEYLPEHKTFIDGRTDFFGEDLVREFSKTTDMVPGWQEPLDKYKISWMLMPSSHRLNLGLAELPWQWRCVHSDAVATIWRKIE